MPVDPRKISWAENSYDERPTRLCSACGKRDKAPRDSVGLPDGNSIYYHFDCHAGLGCSVCQELLDEIANGSGPDGKKDEELWLTVLEESTKKRDKRVSVLTRDDVTGEYQVALDEGRVRDEDWNGGSN
jgi:hypothetical protein